MVGDIDAVLDHAQTVVIGSHNPEFTGIPKRLRSDQFLVDFVRVVYRSETRTAHMMGVVVDSELPVQSFSSSF